MQTDTHLTIQDYFRGKPGAAMRTRALKHTRTDSTIGKSGFAAALEAAQTTAAVDRTGLSIRDYFQNRIQSHRVNSKTGICSSAPSPVALATSDQEAATGLAAAAASVIPTEEPLGKREPPDSLHGTDTSKIEDSIKSAAARFQIPEALISAVVKAESNCRIRAVSPAGAMGLMQLMPATARELGVTDPFDIEQNIHGGARYLRNMLDKFGGDIRLALSAYNAGPGTVAKYDGNVPYAETRAYIQRVMRYAEEYSTTAHSLTTET